MRAFAGSLLMLLMLSLAAGSIIYVLGQPLPMVRRAKMQQVVMAGLIMGFTVAYGTNLVLVAAGA